MSTQKNQWHIDKAHIQNLNKKNDKNNKSDKSKITQSLNALV